MHTIKSNWKSKPKKWSHHKITFFTTNVSRDLST